MNSEEVVVKTFKGHAKSVVVVSATEEIVFVTSKQNKTAIEMGAKSLPIIGFPIRDVFLLKPGMNLARIKWNECQPWQRSN